MSSEPPIETGAVRLRSLAKAYDREAAHHRWRNALPAGPRVLTRAVHAVDAISLDVAPGERVGIIGPNGAGKSTLLELIAGSTEPTSGRIERGGRIGAMIELGIGFHPGLDGWTNVRTAAGVLGMTHAETEAILPDIVAFSGLERAMSSPLRHYSTGMQARLGFAVATHVPADILLVDEALVVGDEEFQERCIARINELCDRGVTLFFVSHEMWAIDSVCERVVHLDRGLVVDDGAAGAVIGRYLGAGGAAAPDAHGPLARFDEFAITPAAIDAWDQLELDLSFTTVTELQAGAVDLEFTWATNPIEHPLARTRHLLDPDLVAGSHHLRGTSVPVPLSSGHGRFRARIVDLRSGDGLCEAVADFWIAPELVGRRPQLAAAITCELTPIEPPAPEQQRTTNVTRSDGEVIAALEEVTKRYWSTPRSNRHQAIPGRRGSNEGADVVALDGVTTEFHRGTATGLVGPNGAGKTTLLRLIARTSTPTSGRLRTDGRVVSMLDLGLGFHGDDSGMDNLWHTARLLGVAADDIRARLDSIVDFADIGPVLEDPVKQYSTGMRARLGLAVAVHADPDLLLVDEVLGVGDEAFRTRAVLVMEELRRKGTAIVLASHDPRLVEEVCDRVLRLERGRVVADGSPAQVLGEGLGGGQGRDQRTEALWLGPLEPDRRRVVVGGRLVLRELVEVRTPCPTMRLELRYYVRSEVHDFTEMDAVERAEHTVLAEPLVGAGSLAEPGWYRLDCLVDRNVIVGEIDVVVTAIEGASGDTAAESWHGVTFGTPSPESPTAVMCPIDVRWERGAPSPARRGV